MNQQYRSNSWIDPRIEVRHSFTQGQGSFAKAPITAGEIVVEWGGVVLTKGELYSTAILPDTEIPIGEGVFLATPANETYNRDYYLNHSCDPSLWMANEVTFAARRDIAPGEELTADYAFWQDDEGLIAFWTCGCSSSLCRGRVTGSDWRLPDLQARYRGHFSPFINARIGKLR